MLSPSLPKEDSSTVEEPASPGDGRHCSLCWTGICGTQPQVDQLATPEGVARHRALPHRRARWPSRPLHRLRTYGLPSPTTRAEIAIAHGARATRACAGSRRANGNCCPLAMSMRFSLCRGNWHRSRYRTSGSSTTCFFTQAPRPCLRSLAIPGILEPRSASSACSIAGISACSFIKEALEKRFAECGLQLHPEKTKIVYCKDDDRRGNSKNESFDFLGYSFRARRSKNRFGKFFVNFSPGVSNAATKAIREEIRRWQLRCRIDKWIDDLARMFNPVIRGWITYYGRYYKSALYPTFRYLDQCLANWAMAKYKRLRRHRQRAGQWVSKTASRDPRLFAHWPLLRRAATGR